MELRGVNRIVVAVKDIEKSNWMVSSKNTKGPLTDNEGKLIGIVSS